MNPCEKSQFPKTKGLNATIYPENNKKARCIKAETKLD
jgi:hypothetical protein